MATVNKEAREAFEEAIAIGQAHDKERKRHRNANERIMVRAATNVYTVHLIQMVKPDGFTPTHTGERGRAEAEDAALKGLVLSAKAYALIIGYSESYVSRLYRLGFGIAAGVLDPHERPENGARTRWQQVSRQVGDTPEVGAVLGKGVEKLPTIEELDMAINTALERKAREREEAEARAPSWVPTAPGEQIGMLEELVEVVHSGRRLTPKQIERVAVVLDELRETVEEWVETVPDDLAVPATLKPLVSATNGG